MAAPDVTVKNNEAENRFEAEIDGALAVAEYERSGDRIVFTHTEVPPAARDQGVADQLARAGLSFAREEGLQVVPRCRYIATWMDRHPEFDDLRAE